MIGPYINWGSVSERSGLSKVTISNYINGKGNCDTTREIIAYYGWIAVKETREKINKLKPINKRNSKFSF